MNVIKIDWLAKLLKKILNTRSIKKKKEKVEHKEEYITRKNEKEHSGLFLQERRRYSK